MAEAKRPRLEEEEEPEAGAEALENDGLEGVAEELQDPEQAAINEADALQVSLEQINDEASDRVLAVEQEFNKKRRPIYTQRNAALSKIPGFWKKVLMVHPVIRGIVTEADLDVMDYLVEIDVEDFEDIKSGFRVTFTFADRNPYFTNRELVKELKFADDASLTVSGTDIQWLPGMEPADDGDDAAQPGTKRAFTPDNHYMLFSSWFDADRAQALISQTGHDDVADVLKDDIWPDPMRWFREAEDNMGALFDEWEGSDDEGDDEGEEPPEAAEGADGAEGVYVIDDDDEDGMEGGEAGADDELDEGEDEEGAEEEEDEGPEEQ